MGRMSGACDSVHREHLQRPGAWWPSPKEAQLEWCLEGQWVYPKFRKGQRIFGQDVAGSTFRSSLLAGRGRVGEKEREQGRHRHREQAWRNCLTWGR